MAVSRATIRAVNILEIIAKCPKGLTLSEISTNLSIPITSVNDIVKALLETGMIEVIDERSKVYGIGVKSYYIGNNYITNTSIVDKSRSIIDNLGKEMGMTVFLAKEVSGKMTYLYKYEPENPLVATCSIGSRTSLHCTSLGKSILAYDESVLNKLKEEDLIKKTENTIVDFEHLKKELATVRINGYALDRLEQNTHLTCVGAPIFDNTNCVIAAISVTGFHSDNRNIQNEGELVRKAALEISKTMGYYGNY